MKITCDFCKTEYSLDSAPASPVKCAICGHTWTAQRPSRRSPILVVFAGFCALLAAGVFSVAAISRHSADQILQKPLVASVTDIATVTDDYGIAHFVVSGNIQNRSADIYGVPDLIIVSMDDDDTVLDKQKFMAPATLLDAGEFASFTHTLSASTVGVKKISAQLDMGDNK